MASNHGSSGIEGQVRQLPSYSLVEGANRSNFGAKPFTKATNATKTINKLVGANIFDEISEILMEKVGNENAH